MKARKFLKLQRCLEQSRNWQFLGVLMFLMWCDRFLCQKKSRSDKAVAEAPDEAAAPSSPTSKSEAPSLMTVDSSTAPSETWDLVSFNGTQQQRLDKLCAAAFAAIKSHFAAM